MILYDAEKVPQGSQRWLELRAGLPTASAFDRIITPAGMPSKSATKYVNELIAERMLGRPLGTVLTAVMDRGKQMEAEAVKYYELQKDLDTTPIGFITTDDGLVGASPDRLVGDRGLLELKCPMDETHSKYIAAHIDALLGQASVDGVYEAYKVQCQGQLYVAERDWSDIVAYYPGLPEAITRVGRDEIFIAKLKRELEKFLEMMARRIEVLRGLGYTVDGRSDPQTPPTAAPKRKAGREPAESAKDPVDLGTLDIDVEAYIQHLRDRGHQFEDEVKNG